MLRLLGVATCAPLTEAGGLRTRVSLPAFRVQGRIHFSYRIPNSPGGNFIGKTYIPEM